MCCFDTAATKASCRLLGTSDFLLSVFLTENETLLSRHTKAELTRFLGVPRLAFTNAADKLKAQDEPQPWITLPGHRGPIESMIIISLLQAPP